MSTFASETAALERIEQVESELREFVRRDVAGLRRQQGNNGKTVADDIRSLLHRVSINSTQEVDWLIGELKTLRDRLEHEGKRVQRDIVAYAGLNEAAMQSTKIIAASLNHWKNVPGAPAI